MIRGVVMYSHFCMVSLLSGFDSNLKSILTKGLAFPMRKLIGRLFGLSAIAGLLTFALITPVAAVAGYASSAGIVAFEGLPEYIKPVNASQTSTLYANQDGKPVALASFYHENRISVDYDQMSPNMINAVVATEDPRFFQHGGVDILALIRATLGVATSGLSGPGGSTITMQYVKNTLVEAANIEGDEAGIALATETTIERKIREIRLAIALESVSTKQEILAGYLNLAFFGNRINGIEAASNYYFGVKAKDLSVPQAAMLTAMLRAPNAYKPDVAENLPIAKTRRDYVINNMRDEGYITAAEAETYKAEPVVPNINETKTGCEANQATAYFCDYVVWVVRNSEEFGPTLEDREVLLRRGGLEIYSTMDLELQNTTDEVVKAELPVDNRWALGAASVSVEVGTGRVLSMSQNRIFDQEVDDDPATTSVNYSTDKAYGGSSGFQTGSTYKIFVLAEWLSKGFLLGDQVDARDRVWKVEDFSAKCGGIAGDWDPNNFGNTQFEYLSALSATIQSVNTAYATMASFLDLCDIRDRAAAFGVKRADGNELLYVQASVLGTNELSPLTMAAAMSGFANDGIYCSPIAIDRVVVRSTGLEMKVPTTECNRAVTSEVAAAASYAFQLVVSGGTGSASRTPDRVPLAGKTGSTDRFLHTWMTGYSSKVATATWVGNVSGAQNVGGVSIDGTPGGILRHEIWRQIMTVANELYPGEAFPSPPSMYLGASTVVMPDVNALPPEIALEILRDAGLAAQISASQVLSSNPPGTVAAADHATGAQLPRGTLVTISLSRGGTVAVPDVAGLSIADATARLLSYGFSAVSAPQPSQGQYFVHSSTVPDGMVVGTNPPAGSSADALGAVLLIISKGP
ncbi:MAG: PASTA domain-containing protein [Actinobacteria bacterium]|nr:PASTA domain-containing protein [Actinomycetota bacterium]MSZ16805.1 PASTA domain-containing protein [Actinomycetota bacterium]MTA83446.1 PASTA domain-containing protein [Actinomycetota bacterium]